MCVESLTVPHLTSPIVPPQVSLLFGLGMAILFSAPNVMMGAGLIYGTSLLKDARTERQMQHSFLVRTAGGFNTTLQLCAKPCDEYNLATVHLQSVARPFLSLMLDAAFCFGVGQRRLQHHARALQPQHPLAGHAAQLRRFWRQGADLDVLHGGSDRLLGPLRRGRVSRARCRISTRGEALYAAQPHSLHRSQCIHANAQPRCIHAMV